MPSDAWAGDADPQSLKQAELLEVLLQKTSHGALFVLRFHRALEGDGTFS